MQMIHPPQSFEAVASPSTFEKHPGFEPSLGSITIRDFCTRYSISRATFYRGLRRGLMPRAVKLGSRTFILIRDLHVWEASLPTANTPFNESQGS
jgi:hypothetical protein